MDTSTPSVQARRLLDGRLKLRHLVFVDTLTEQGSVVGAAAALHVAQPVVTRALQDLEAILGVTLYERGPRGITPTEFGLAFTDHARDVLAQLRMAGRHIDELAQGSRGTVIIGSHLAGVSLLLPRAILRLKAQHPGATVIVREGSPEKLAVDLDAGQLDFIVGRLTSPETEKFEHDVLYSDGVRLVVGGQHALAGREYVPLEELMDLMWVIPVAETSLRAELERLLTRRGHNLPINRIETTLFLTVRRILMESEAVAALPRRLVIDDPGLCILPTKLEGIGTTVGITLVRGRRLSLTAERMRGCLGETAATLDH